MHAWLSRLDRYFPVRYTVWSLSVLLTIGFAIYWYWTGTGDVAAIVCAVLVAVGIRDMLQSQHSVLRNYPLIGHLRFLLEFIRPEIRQYFIESDNEETPFSRAQRSIVYQRAKGDAGQAAVRHAARHARRRLRVDQPLAGAHEHRRHRIFV